VHDEAAFEEERIGDQAIEGWHPSDDDDEREETRKGEHAESEAQPLARAPHLQPALRFGRAPDGHRELLCAGSDRYSIFEAI
jgi:hypothetical protein